MHWQDTENSMVLPHAEPDDPTPDHDEDEAFEKQRQQDIDLEKEKRASPHRVSDEAKEISQNLLDEFKKIFDPEGANFPTDEHKGKWW
jgi:hypothetical protein